MVVIPIWIGITNQLSPQVGAKFLGSPWLSLTWRGAGAGHPWTGAPGWVRAMTRVMTHGHHARVVTHALCLVSLRI